MKSSPILRFCKPLLERMPQKTRKQQRRQGGTRAKSMRKRNSMLTSLGKSIKRSQIARLAHSIKFPHVNRTMKATPLRSVYMGTMKLEKKAERQAAKAAHKAYKAQQAAMKEIARMARIARGNNSNSNNNSHKSHAASTKKRNVGLNYITRMMSTGKSFVGLINQKEKPKSTRKKHNKMNM